VIILNSFLKGKHMKYAIVTLVAINSLNFGGTARAFESEQGAHLIVAAAASADATMAEGEIRKVDKEAGKLTIKHGPLQHLDMPAMTMVFQVKDKAVLDQYKPGDKVNFKADQVNGAYTVTTIERAK
jgi:Cu(I)/Ag(I) efflux system periplasmic protein CusF